MNLIERIGAIVSLVGAFLGGWVYMESTFASQEALKAVESTFKQSMSELRRKTIEDQVFTLEFKQVQNPKSFQAIDKALLERYKRELQDIQNKGSSN